MVLGASGLLLELVPRSVVLRVLVSWPVVLPPLSFLLRPLLEHARLVRWRQQTICQPRPDIRKRCQRRNGRGFHCCQKNYGRHCHQVGKQHCHKKLRDILFLCDEGQPIDGCHKGAGHTGSRQGNSFKRDRSCSKPSGRQPCHPSGKHDIRHIRSQDLRNVQGDSFQFIQQTCCQLIARIPQTSFCHKRQQKRR